jgi:hypothetical protein
VRGAVYGGIAKVAAPSSRPANFCKHVAELLFGQCEWRERLITSEKKHPAPGGVADAYHGAL